MSEQEENISKLRSTIQHLDRLAEIGKMTAGIIHEIRNPLNFINNFSNLNADIASEMLEILGQAKDQLDADSYADLAELCQSLAENSRSVLQHGQRASRIVNGMLAQARKEEGAIFSVDFNTMVSDFTNLGYHGVRGSNRDFNTSIDYQLDPAIGKVNVAPDQFGRVVINIVTNACQAMEEKMVAEGMEGYQPRLWVTTRKQAGEVVLTIKDNGPGMPQSVIDKIFTPFFTTKGVDRGTGLGLSMSKDIVEVKHQGRLEVESLPGEHTLFRISIPDSLKISLSRD